MNIRESLYGIEPYNPPEKLITPQQYRERLLAISKDRNLTQADEQFFSDLEDLRNDLYDLITYNTDDLEVKGNKYYVSTNGDDNNDGLTPKTAWSTLEKVTEFKFKEGDGVYFKRGDLWRGCIIMQDGVTYQAYGKGPSQGFIYPMTV